MKLGRAGLVGGLLAATLLWLGLGNALVWGPLWRHFHVDADPVDAAVLQRHRQVPADSVLAAVADASMMTDHPLQGVAAVQAARRILAGELALPSLPVLPIGPGFSAAQLEAGVPVQQVFIASLIVPDLLLRAYEHTPDPAFLAAAERYLRGFATHEAAAQFPTGLLFNAHAVANRAAVLARFWRHARASADEPLARDVHRLAQRTAALLCKPSLFIAGTNHGVMQNVALLQLAAAFPALPGTEARRDLAQRRLDQQLPMYIAADGAVLEHAAGYHFHGVVLSGYVVRLLREMGQPVPANWLRAHDASRQVLATLQRPDGSLPPIGNTYRYAWRLPALVVPDGDGWAHALQGRPSFTQTLPLSGQAVWWDGEGIQTVVPWGWFAQHGHTRAQEMSLLIWADGTDWNTNTGYWPNGDEAGFNLAAGWAGGNGPHLVGEAGHSRRRTSVLAQAQRDGLRLLDLERVVADGPRVRRQIIQWQARQWLVLDSFDDAQQRPLRVLWTGAPETVQTAADERAFTLRREGSPLRFTVAVEGSPGVTATALSGSRSPFGGWVAFDRQAVAAPAVDARLPAGWMLTTLQLTTGDTATPLRARMQRYTGPDDWEVVLPLGDTPVRLARRGSELRVDDSARVPLTAAAPVDAELAAIERAGDAVRREFPRFRTGEAERRQQSVLLAGLWLVTCAALLWLARRQWTAAQKSPH